MEKLGWLYLRRRPPLDMAAERDEQENGKRNLHEAAIHTQWRTRARLFRKASVSNPRPLRTESIATSDQPSASSMSSSFRLLLSGDFQESLSASRTSSSVSVPDSTRCAMIGRLRPPNKANSSSISLRSAASRDTAASKMKAVAIFLVRFNAFLTSRR